MCVIVSNNHQKCLSLGLFVINLNLLSVVPIIVSKSSVVHFFQRICLCQIYGAAGRMGVQCTGLPLVSSTNI